MKLTLLWYVRIELLSLLRKIVCFVCVGGWVREERVCVCMCGFCVSKECGRGDGE